MKTMKRLVMNGVTVGLILVTGCADVVVKVEKKPRPNDFSGVSSQGDANGLQLAGAEDFLKHLDDLKVMGVDLLIRKMNERDYKSLLRGSLRKYRSSLVDKALGNVKLDSSFYGQLEDKCIEKKLSFNMEESDELLGMILQTAVLAKISEVSAGKLNSGLSKELAAIAQLIKIELGLEVSGDSRVETVDGVTTTSGEFAIGLAAIDGEKIDEQTKANDATEVLKISFKRESGADYVGSFTASLSVDHTRAGELKTVVGSIAVDRKNVDGKFVHSMGFSVGELGAPATFSRKLTFEQMNASDKVLKITDAVKGKDADEKRYITVLDLEKRTACKFNGNQDASNGDGIGAGDIGDEGGFLPTPSTIPSTPTRETITTTKAPSTTEAPADVTTTTLAPATTAAPTSAPTTIPSKATQPKDDEAPASPTPGKPSQNQGPTQKGYVGQK